MQTFLLLAAFAVGAGSGENLKDIGRVSLNANADQEWELVRGTWGRQPLAKDQGRLLVMEGQVADVQFGPRVVGATYRTAVRVHLVTGLPVFPDLPDLVAHGDSRCLRIDLPPTWVEFPALSGAVVGEGALSLVFKRVR